MHDILRERLMRGLEALPEERLYQVLDYVEFLGSKYARDGSRTAGSPIRRFSERLEDHMRLQGVGLNAIKGTMGVMDTADRFVNDLTEAGRSLLREVEQGLRPPVESRDKTEVKQGSGPGGQGSGGSLPARSLGRSPGTAPQVRPFIAGPEAPSQPVAQPDPRPRREPTDPQPPTSDP